MLLNNKPLASTLNVCNPMSTIALQDAVDHHYQRGGKVRNGRFTELVDTLLGNRVDTSFCLHRLCNGHWDEFISPIMVDRLLESTSINNTDADGCIAIHYLIRHLD